MPLIDGEGPQVQSHGLVLPRCVAIGLCMESGRQPVIITQARANLIPESSRKFLSVISNKVISYDGFTDHVFEKSSCQLW